MATVQELGGVMALLKWGNISEEYFGFPRGWIYQRLNGYDGNGNKCEFTEAQKETLRAALHDMADRLNEAADRLRQSPSSSRI